MLVLRDVSRSLGKGILLDHVNVEIEAGAPTAFLGLTAAEQEALLRLLEGVDKPSSGSINLGGKDIAQVKRRRGGIVRVGAEGVRPSSQRVGQLVGQQSVQRVRLAAKWSATVRELDQADRVRLAIALAVEAGPDLLLLAAPTSGMESDPAGAFLADLTAMLAGLHSAVVLAGAGAEGRALGGPVVMLSQGRVVQAGPVAEVAAAPMTLGVAKAVGAPVLNVLPMTVRGAAGVLADGSVFQPPEGVVLPAEGVCSIAFYADDVTLERRDAGCVRFVVRATGEGGKSAGLRYAKVQFGGAAWLTPMPEQRPVAGMVLNAFVERSRLMVFDAEGKALRGAG